MTPRLSQARRLRIERRFEESLRCYNDLLVVAIGEDAESAAERIEILVGASSAELSIFGRNADRVEERFSEALDLAGRFRLPMHQALVLEEMDRYFTLRDQPEERVRILKRLRDVLLPLEPEGEVMRRVVRLLTLLVATVVRRPEEALPYVEEWLSIHRQRPWQPEHRVLLCMCGWIYATVGKAGARELVVSALDRLEPGEGRDEFAACLQAMDDGDIERIRSWGWTGGKPGLR